MTRRGIVAKCSRDVWERNKRGAYHTHSRQEQPPIWEAGNGRWRVRGLNQPESAPPRYSLERRTDEGWKRIEGGRNMDDLLAVAVVRDDVEFGDSERPQIVCWLNEEQ